MDGSCLFGEFVGKYTGSTISTLLHDKINPKKFQVLSLGDTGFLQFFRVVSRDYGKPRYTIVPLSLWEFQSLSKTHRTLQWVNEPVDKRRGVFWVLKNRYY